MGFWGFGARGRRNQQKPPPAAGHSHKQAESRARVLRVHDVEEPRDYLAPVPQGQQPLNGQLGRAVEREDSRRDQIGQRASRHLLVQNLRNRIGAGGAHGWKRRVRAHIHGVLPAALALGPGRALHLDGEFGAVRRPIERHLGNDEQRRQLARRTPEAAATGRHRPATSRALQAARRSAFPAARLRGS